METIDFIDDHILSTNIKTVVNHINELSYLSGLTIYSQKPVQVSSFRKTIIIHIAAIIEAILLWKLKKVVNQNKIELTDDWKYSEVHVLYTINGSQQIIAGKRVKEKRHISKLDFIQITRLCYKHGIIKSSRLVKDIDKVREFRNRQHLGGLAIVEEQYSKPNLEFCFNVADRVISEVAQFEKK